MAQQGGHRGFVWDGRKWRHIVGLPGKDGQSIVMKGHVADAASLPLAGAQGDAYVTDDDKHLHTWDGSGWVDLGDLSGPQGIPGLDGLDGQDGAPGETLKPNGFVADYAGLPVTPPDLSVYVTQDNVTMYVYQPSSAAADGLGWVNMGQVQGPPGADGHPATIRSSVLTAANLPAVGQPGDMRVTMDDGHIHGWDDARQIWVDGGEIRGAGGVAGTGSGLSMWADGDYPQYTVVIHNDKIWLAALDAFTGDEPGVIPQGATVSGSWSLLTPGSYGGMQTVANPQGGTPSLDLYDFLNTAVAANKAYLLTTPNQQPYTPTTGTFAGRVFNNRDLLIYTGNKNAGTLGWIVVPEADWGSGTYQWTATVSSSWTSLGGGDMALGDLTDVDPGGANTLDTLYFLAGKWVPGSAAIGHPTMEQIKDANISGVADGDLLRWDAASSRWVNGPNPAPTLTHLADTDSSLPLDHQAPVWNTLADMWEWVEVATPSQVTAELNAAVSSLASGLSHQQPVDEIVNTPDPNVPDGHIVIVGTAPTGVFAGHANQVGQHLAGAWQFTAPHANDTHLNEADGMSYTWNGTAWVITSSGSGGSGTSGGGLPVGSIMQSVLSEIQFTQAYPAEAGKWLPADGRACVGTRYAQLLGVQSVPDLRGAYLVMAGQSSRDTSWNGGGLRGFANWMTGMARNRFGVSQSSGGHKHGMFVSDTSAQTVFSIDTNGNQIPDAYLKSGNNLWSVWGGTRKGTKDNLMPDAGGTHTHPIAGGDALTRPNTYAVTYFIRVND